MNSEGWIPRQVLGTSLRWFDFSGPDVTDFLQRLSTVDPRRIPIGCGAPAAFLTATGKFESFFILWKLTDDSFGIEFDDPTGENARQLVAFIEKFTFAERFQLTPLSPDIFEGRFFLGGTFPIENRAQPQPYETTAVEPGIRIQNWGRQWFGQNLWTVWSHPGALQVASEITPSLEALRIGSLAPWWGSEIHAGTSPLEIGLPHAIQSGKGCYPGQEVIERIWSLGSPALRLARVVWNGAPPRLSTGEKIYNSASPPMAVGTITTHAENRSLALLRKLQAVPGTEVTTQTGARGEVELVADYQTPEDA